MLKSAVDARGEILAAAARGPLRITTIDPGTNCALRHSELTLLAPDAGGRAAFRTRPLGQGLFLGGTAGGCYAERMAGLAAFLGEDPLFWEADYYLIESQFELNVAISVGVLLGIISARRPRPEHFRTKRSGARAADRLPYEVLSAPPQLKSHAIHSLCGERPTRENIKALGIAAAREICARAADAGGAALLEGAKADDFADAVCIEHGLFAHLADAAALAAPPRPRRGAPGQKDAAPRR